ncbi:MAG: hypothetical protein ACQEWV_21855 [Bacillota bacterium]
MTKYSDVEGTYSGNFSNTYQKGTKYYSIEGISIDEAIAIQDKYGKYKKAIREEEYKGNKNKFREEEYTGNKNDFSGLDFSTLVAGFLVLFIIAAFVIFFVEKRLKR